MEDEIEKLGIKRESSEEEDNLVNRNLFDQIYDKINELVSKLPQNSKFVYIFL